MHTAEGIPLARLAVATGGDHLGTHRLASFALLAATGAQVDGC